MPSLPDVLHDARLVRDRNRLVEAAAIALHADPAASMASIAAVAGLSSVTAHRLFADRLTLLRAVREQGLGDLEAAIARARLDEGEPMEALRRLTVQIVAGARTWALLPRAAWVEGVDDATLRRFARLQVAIDDVIERLRPGVPFPDARTIVGDALAAAGEAVATGASGRATRPRRRSG